MGDKAKNMDKLISIINNAPAEQVTTFIAAFAVWFIGGYLLKRKLRQRLESQNIEFSENIEFEDVDKKEWVIFALLAAISIGLIILAIYLPALLAL